VLTVPAALVVGLGLALLANLRFRVKWPARLGLLLPSTLPLVFAGPIFRWFFEYQQGIVNDVLLRLGFEKLRWLSSPGLAFAATSIAIVWKSSSFVALIFRAMTAIQTFAIPYAMTGGGPGEPTETLAMYIHKTTVDFLDFGYGWALAVPMFQVSAAAISVYLRRISREEDAR
jgi:multiple sugar transport system permease protein